LRAPFFTQVESAHSIGDDIDKILHELDVVQGKPMELGGYYHADPAKVAAAMRASQTLNAIIGD